MLSLIHTIEVLLAGIWLGGVVFTTVVVTPALKAMKWDEAERIQVRSVIGRHYAPVATLNLALLLISSVLLGLTVEPGGMFYSEIALVLVLFALATAHGVYFGPRLSGLAAAQQQVSNPDVVATVVERRHALQRLSLAFNVTNLAVSFALLALIANA